MTEQNTPAGTPQPATPRADSANVTPSASASATEAPSQTPPAESAPTSAPVEAKAPQDTQPAPEAPKAEKVGDSLLGETIKPQEAKAAEAVEAVAEKPKEDSQSEKTAQLPTFEPFTLPEGFEHDEVKLAEFTKQLAELQLSTKADQKTMQEFGQKLMDQYVGEVQKLAQDAQQHFVSEYQTKLTGWKEDALKAPDIQTVLDGANKAISFLPEDLQKPLQELAHETGVGANQTFLRALSHYEKVITAMQNKYENESSKALPAPAQISKKPTSLMEKLYGTTNN